MHHDHSVAMQNCPTTMWKDLRTETTGALFGDSPLSMEILFVCPGIFLIVYFVQLFKVTLVFSELVSLI